MALLSTGRASKRVLYYILSTVMTSRWPFCIIFVQRKYTKRALYCICPLERHQRQRFIMFGPQVGTPRGPFIMFLSIIGASKTAPLLCSDCH